MINMRVAIFCRSSLCSICECSDYLSGKIYSVPLGFFVVKNCFVML